MSTFLELINQAKLEIGAEGGALTQVTGHVGMPAKLVDWTASTDYYIQSLYFDWNFLWTQLDINTIAGTSLIDPPADMGAWDRDSFWLDYTTDDGIKMDLIDYKDWRDDLRFGVKTNDTPTVMVIRPDGKLKLDPPPNKVYALTADYWKAPVKMTANADVPLIPAEFQRIIVARVKMYFAEEQEVPNLYEIAKLEYDEIFARLISHELPGQINRYLVEAPSMAVRTV